MPEPAIVFYSGILFHLFLYTDTFEVKL